MNIVYFFLITGLLFIMYASYKVGYIDGKDSGRKEMAFATIEGVRNGAIRRVGNTTVFNPTLFK